jgi:hypothetical protein
LAGGLLAIAEGLLAFILCVFQRERHHAKNFVAKFFAYRAFHPSRRLFFAENKENVLSVPGLPLNNRTQSHKGFLKGLFRFRYRYR